MPQAGAVISHDISWPRNVTRLGDIAVVTLVNAVESEQICCRPCGGGGVFVMPDHHGDVVTQGHNGSTTQVDCLGNDVLLGKEAGKFQVGVGDVSLRIVRGDQSGLNVGRERCPPQHGLDVGVGSRREPHTPHASTRGIMGANGHWVVRNNFGKLGGPGGQGVGEVLKIIEHVAHLGGDADAVAIGVSQAFL